MSKTHIPGDDTYEADLTRLLDKIDLADTAYKAGKFRKSAGPESMKVDIVSRGEVRLRPKS